MPAVQLGGASHSMNHQDDLIFLGWFFSFDCSAFKMRPRHILKMHPLHPNHDRPKIVETSQTCCAELVRWSRMGSEYDGKIPHVVFSPCEESPGWHKVGTMYQEHG